MNQSDVLDQPYKGQKFTSFEHLKKYLEEYGQKNYVKFWIRSSHTRHSQKSKISKTMNPDLKYVSVKFACIFGGEKIRCRGSGIRRSYTYRNLGCPCMINAVVGEDGNHVKLDTVILEHNHALCKTLYDSLKKTKRKSPGFKNSNESSKELEVENLSGEKVWLEADEMVQTLDGNLESNESCLKDVEDKYGKIVKILVINSENQNINNQDDLGCDEFRLETYNKEESGEGPQVCRLCLSSKEKLSPIFNPDLPVKSTVLSFKIMGCASIEISCDDGLPNNICTTCEANLDIAYNFRITCEKSDSILRETYSKSTNVDSTREDETEEKSMVVYPGDDAEETTDCPQPPELQQPLYLSLGVVCPVCETDFDSHESMLDHLGTHTDDETFLLACNICTLVCPSVRDLREHMREHLKAESNSPGEDLKAKKTEVKYLCYVCGKIFKTKDRFQAHKNMHEGLRPHVCLQCGRGFADRKNLHQHYDTVHLRKVRHECPVCQRKFYTRTKMKSHMTMHSGDKPFTCDVCNKTFRLKMNMNKHKKTHTNERPYQCDKCNAAFIEKNLLKRHSYKHGGVRPFRCPVCGHGFSAKFCLKKHLKDSKCRGVVIADPESYHWVRMDEPDVGLDDGKCVVVYKTEEGQAVQEAETIDLNILGEYKDESNT